MRIAVLIPCYNEELTINKVIQDFKRELPDSEIYVYDNNCTDRTAEIAKRAGAIVKTENKQGKGNVVKTMFKEIGADIYVMVDGDDTYNAKDVHTLIKTLIYENADMVVGDRIKSGDYKKQNKRKLHVSGNNFVKWVVNKLFKANYNDVMTGYRVFNKKFVKNISLETTHFEIETEMSIKGKMHNFKVIEVPIKYADRPEGSKSKLKTIRDGIKILRYIFKSWPAPVLKKILSIILTFFILILTYVGTLTLVSTFSSKYIKSNVQQSSQILLEQMDNESQYRMLVYIPYRIEKLEFDNPTDALMINTAYSINNKTPFMSAMLARKNYVENVTTKENGDINGSLVSSNKYGVQYHPIKELYNIANDNPDESFEYSRYWHGYLVILRPLLLIFNITTMRIILTILICALLLYVLKLIYKKLGITTSIIFFIGFLLTEMFFIGLSLQGAPIVIIMLISSILVLKKEKISLLNFFVIGSLTNFFDFLTSPIITLAIPLILDILIKQKKNEFYTIKDYLKMVFIPSITWLLAYAGTWAAKWIIMQMFCNRNIIEVAFEQIKYRSFKTECTYYMEFVSIFEKLLNGVPVMLLAMIGFIIYILKNLYNIKNIETKQNFRNLIPFAIIGMFPIIWGCILKNHTYNHAFFTYRILMVFAICFGIILDKISIKKQK